MSDFRIRVEVSSHSEAAEPGLQARLADPLWMLARQWQVGELTGEDAATPVLAEVEGLTCRVDRLGKDPLSPGQALEAEVEHEPVTRSPGAWRLAAEAGLELLRELDARSLAPRKAMRKALKARLPLSPPEGLTPSRRNDMALLVRRSFDGHTALALHSTGKLSSTLEAIVPGRLHGALRLGLDAWAARTEGRFLEPNSAAPRRWRPSRLEYRFELSAGTPAGRARLVAEEYAGGHLDRQAFDLSPSEAEPKDGETWEKALIPKPLRYPGMPASRWWAFEDGQVHLAGVDAGETDLARVLLAHYGVVYGDDWFLIPMRLPAGAMHRVQRLRVTDAFGDRRMIKSTAVADGSTRPWRFLELSGDRGPAQGQAPWLLTPAVNATTLEGPPLERVELFRDEGANLGWAVEAVVEGADARPVHRGEVEERVSDPSLAELASSRTWRYRLSSRGRPHEIPLVPVVVGDGPDIRLQRARMPDWDEDDGPRGEVLLPKPLGPLRIHEEEIPREGLTVTRRWQLARRSDGAVVMWVGRRKQPGHGEAALGISFDGLAPQED